jgi:hypothetical protein
MGSVLGDRKNIHQITDEFAEVYGKKPQLERLGSLEDLYNTMQTTFKKYPSNIFAYLAMYVPDSNEHCRGQFANRSQVLPILLH